MSETFTIDEDVIRAARSVKLLVMDCDGVLTDGSLFYGENGEAFKVFDAKDGFGIVSWRRAGFASAIISGRNSKIVDIRGGELGINFIIQSAKNKGQALEELLRRANVSPEECCVVGDDIPDLEMFEIVNKAKGLTVAVADAAQKVRARASYVTRCPGGRGAVREITDLLLYAKQEADKQTIN